MKVNEIFYSIQGEGFYTGRAAVFVRMSGCNLRCHFCDTIHEPFIDMSADEIISEIRQYPSDFVVITGGEPCMQITDEFVDLLHKNRKYVSIETNGTIPPPSNVDWITCSPKGAFVGHDGDVAIKSANEVKVVYDGNANVDDFGIVAEHYYIQPCDVGDDKKNEVILNECIQFIKNNTKWNLSLQTQKMLKVR